MAEILGGSYVPKVASNCSTINGCFGAVAALHFQFRNHRYVPVAADNARICGWFEAKRKTSPETCSC
jgi:hypothetical protein